MFIGGSIDRRLHPSRRLLLLIVPRGLLPSLGRGIAPA